MSLFLLIGQRGVSGSAPCRWYINEDLPEINAIHARLASDLLHAFGTLANTFVLCTWC